MGCLWPTDSASFLSTFTSPLVGMGFDFNSYHLVASHLSLDMGYLFFLVGSNILPWMAVQQLVAILVFSQEKMKTRPSAPPS